MWIIQLADHVSQPFLIVLVYILMLSYAYKAMSSQIASLNQFPHLTGSPGSQGSQESLGVSGQDVSDVPIMVPLTASWWQSW